METVVIGRGKYQFMETYKCLEVKEADWFRMTSDSFSRISPTVKNCVDTWFVQVLKFNMQNVCQSTRFGMFYNIDTMCCTAPSVFSRDCGVLL